MTDLTQAIAEVKRVTPANDPWTADDLNAGHAPIDDSIAIILNAVASGELILKADAKLAVAEAYRKAAEIIRAKWNDPDTDGQTMHDDILALADTDALAELQALRVVAKSANQNWLDNLDAEARAEAAEPELATLRAQVEMLTRDMRAIHHQTNHIINDARLISGNGVAKNNITYCTSQIRKWSEHHIDQPLAALEGAKP